MILSSTLVIRSVCLADDTWSPWRNAQQSDSIQYRYKVTDSGVDVPATCDVEVRNTQKNVVILAVQASVTLDQTTGRVTMKRNLQLDKSTQIGSDALPNCKKVISFAAIATSRGN
jgi:hypothetical protein